MTDIKLSPAQVYEVMLLVRKHLGDPRRLFVEPGYDSYLRRALEALEADIKRIGRQR